jgi:putative membrane protein
MGLVNALIKPILVLFSFPFIALTLGFFLIIINAGMLYLTAYFVDGFRVSGFAAAFWGSLVISIVSWVLSNLINAAKPARKD